MSEEKVFKFMAYRKIAAILSVVLIMASIGSLAVNQIKFGLDFTGGTLLEVGYDDPVPLELIRSQLADEGYKNYTVVNFGSETDVLVRLQQSQTPELGDEILSILRKAGVNVDLRRIEYVGPQVGEELRDDGGLGMLLALAVVMLYVAFRFQVKFAVGAVVALIHDVVIILGLFSLMQWDFDLTVLAALLAVIGYSLNDTIVVSDRIRENFRKIRKGTEEEIINISLTQTFGRTIITSLTTALVLLALFLFGGELIHGFAKALLIGVFVGTYSSIYVAANVLLTMNVSKEDLIIPVKEGVDEELENMP